MEYRALMVGDIIQLGDEYLDANNEKWLPFILSVGDVVTSDDLESEEYRRPILRELDKLRCELAQLRAENAALKTFVTKLASHPCENFTAGWDCNVDGRTATAEDCADRMCIPCQAREVLDNK